MRESFRVSTINTAFVFFGPFSGLHLIITEKIYKEIIKLDNKNSDSYCALGTINAMRKKYKEALDFFLITIKLEPKNYFAFNNLGSICFKFQKFNEAL